MLDYINNIIRKASGSSHSPVPVPSPDPGIELLPSITVSREEIGESGISADDSFGNATENNGNQSDVIGGKIGVENGIISSEHDSHELNNNSSKTKNNFKVAGSRDSITSGENAAFNQNTSLPVGFEKSTAKVNRPADNFRNQKKSTGLNEEQINKPGNQNLLDIYTDSSVPSKNFPNQRNDMADKIIKPAGVRDEINFYHEGGPVFKKDAAGNDYNLDKRPESKILNIEPAYKANFELFADELNGKIKKSLLSGDASKGEQINSRSPEKEISINIGRIELNAGKKTSSPAKRTVKGFDQHIMMRLYLDRHYY